MASPQFVLSANHQQDVAQVHECRSGNDEDLDDPEACVRHGEGSIVAGILAARAFGVTVHVSLFISPYCIYASS